MTDTSNFASRITALEDSFEAEVRKSFGALDHAQGERPQWLYPRSVVRAMDHINTAAAILRDYASREAG